MEEYTKYTIDHNNREALEKAEDYYREALKYDSTFAQAYTGLAMVYYYKNYRGTFFSENFLDTIRILADIALSHDDQLGEAYYLKAVYDCENGKVTDAIKNLDKTLTLNPNYSKVNRLEGDIYIYVLNDYVNAIKQYEKAIILNRGKELPQLLYSLGRAYLDAGFVEKARQYYREAYALNGDSVTFNSYNNWLEYSIGNFEEAIEINNKAFAFDQRGWYGYYYSILGKDDEAYQIYKNLVDQTKGTGYFPLSSSHRIGYSFWKAGKIEEADYYFKEQIKYCEESIRLGRSYVITLSAFYDLAAVYAFFGNREKSYQYLNEFSQKETFPLWFISLIKHDPLFDSLRGEDRFQKITKLMEAKHQAEHERVRKWLEEQG